MWLQWPKNILWLPHTIASICISGSSHFNLGMSIPSNNHALSHQQMVVCNRLYELKTFLLPFSIRTHPTRQTSRVVCNEHIYPAHTPSPTKLGDSGSQKIPTRQTEDIPKLLHATLLYLFISILLWLGCANSHTCAGLRGCLATQLSMGKVKYTQHHWRKIEHNYQSACDMVN